ncbi:MAG: MarR family transcriptional regulator [Candidatus Dormiibacterota bacterium]
MERISTQTADATRRRRLLNAAIRDSLRELRLQLARLNHEVGARLDLRDVDLNCLDLIEREGPLSPSVLAQTAGIHPATVTGILDRLESAGFVTRDRDSSDRRAVMVKGVRERGVEVMRLYSGMNSAVSRICKTYRESQLEVVADFLRRTTAAGRVAADDLSAPASDQGPNPRD